MRSGAPNLPHAPEEPLILFDGYCGLCDRLVAFILRVDHQKLFHFAPLQSEIGKEILRTQGLSSEHPKSLVLLESGRVKQKSTAALSVLGLLGWPWKLAVVFLLVPSFLRDSVYDFVASNRYKWFGKHATCRLPTPAERERFLA